MKHLLLLVLTILVWSSLSAQLENSLKDLPSNTPPVYLSLGGGINHTGLFSVGVEVPVVKNIAVFADTGVGGWGYKLGLGASYYFDYVNKGSSINVAFYYASGIRNSTVNITIENQNTIPIFIKPTATINLTYAHHWQLGAKSKFALVGGYAAALGSKQNAFDVAIAGISLDDLGRRVVNWLHPDGLILGMKFLIGLGGN